MTDNKTRPPDLRMIPCLLLKGAGLVKTVRFEEPKYLGDPINIVRIFNEKEADELCLLDITATAEGRPPNFDAIEQIASECFMPVSYGGGLSNIEDCRKVLGCGFEKVVLGSFAAETPKLVEDAALAFGSQSVIVSVDVLRKDDGTMEVRNRNGKNVIGSDPVAHVREIADRGAGEILLTAIHRDGTMQGFDQELIQAVAASVSVPVIACGGARDLDDLIETLAKTDAAAVAAGSLVVYYGRLRAVLINPPSHQDLTDAWLRFMTKRGASLDEGHADPDKAPDRIPK